MKQTYIYLLENKKTKEQIWALQRCYGWKVIKKNVYTFTQSGLC